MREPGNEDASQLLPYWQIDLDLLKMTLFGHKIVMIAWLVMTLM